MRRISILENSSPGGKLLLLTGLVILSGIVSAFSGLLIGKVYYGVDLKILSEFIANPQTIDAIAFTRFYQFINQVGIFILPSLMFVFLVSQSSLTYLRLNSRLSVVSLLVSGLMIYSILPFNHFLGEWNANMVLPDFLSGIENWMKASEEQARVLTELFLSTDTIAGLMINLVIVALIPSIGEEMLFRGIVLRLMKELTRSTHLAVIISAFIFSFIHLQFYGFLPRFLLGIMLGYMFVFTGNLWVPMFAHFVNNASSVIIFYLHHNDYIKVPMDDFGSSPNPVFIIGSLLITTWLMLIVYQREGISRSIQ